MSKVVKAGAASVAADVLALRFDGQADAAETSNGTDASSTFLNAGQQKPMMKKFDEFRRRYFGSDVFEEEAAQVKASKSQQSDGARAMLMKEAQCLHGVLGKVSFYRIGDRGVGADVRGGFWDFFTVFDLYRKVEDGMSKAEFDEYIEQYEKQPAPRVFPPTKAGTQEAVELELPQKLDETLNKWVSWKPTGLDKSVSHKPTNLWTLQGQHPVDKAVDPEEEVLKEGGTGEVFEKALRQKQCCNKVDEMKREWTDDRTTYYLSCQSVKQDGQCNPHQEADVIIEGVARLPRCAEDLTCVSSSRKCEPAESKQ